jgi:hypothetical protein
MVEAVMPIRAFLRGKSFDPGTISAMSAALEEACQALHIAADSPTRTMVARMIILLVEEGATPADQLAARVVREMRGAQPT